MGKEKDSRLNIFQIITIGFFFIMLSSPWVFYFTGIQEIYLYGEYSIAEKPIYSVKTGANGEYQNNLNTWFNQNFPMNTRLVQMFSQMKFSAFQVSNATDLVIGKENYFFGNSSYIKTELGMDQPYDLQLRLNEYAQDLRSLQDNLDQLGKPFIYVIAPNKPHIYPEYIPDRYYIAASTQPNKVYYLNMLKQALEDAGVRHIDANEFLLPYKDDYQLFAKTGLHWNYIAAALVGEELATNPDYKMNLPFFSMSGVGKVEEPVAPDADLYLLSNLSSPIKNNPYYYPQLEKAKRTEDIYAFMAGSSYCEELGRLLIDAEVINDVKLIQYSRMFYYYNKEETTSDIFGDIADIDYELMINNSDIFIFSNLPAGHNEEIHLTVTNINNTLEKMIQEKS